MPEISYCGVCAKEHPRGAFVCRECYERGLDWMEKQGRNGYLYVRSQRNRIGRSWNEIVEFTELRIAALRGEKVV